MAAVIVAIAPRRPRSRRRISYRPAQRRQRATHLQERPPALPLPLGASGLRSRVSRKLEISAAALRSSGSRTLRRAPPSSRVIACSRRATRHLRGSPSRALRGTGRASEQRSGRNGEAVSARPAPSARAPRRSSPGRSPARAPRRGRGCRAPAPGERWFEGGPARSTFLLPRGRAATLSLSSAVRKGSGGRPACRPAVAAWCSLREGQAAHCPWKLSAVLPELAGAGTLFWHAR